MKKLRALLEISSFIVVGSATEKVLIPSIKKQVATMTNPISTNPYYKTKPVVKPKPIPKPLPPTYDYSYYKTTTKTQPLVKIVPGKKITPLVKIAPSKKITDLVKIVPSTKIQPIIPLKPSTQNHQFKAFMNSKEIGMDKNVKGEQGRMGYSSGDRDPEFYGWVIGITKQGQFNTFLGWLKRLGVYNPQK